MSAKKKRFTGEGYFAEAAPSLVPRLVAVREAIGRVHPVAGCLPLPTLEVPATLADLNPALQALAGELFCPRGHRAQAWIDARSRCPHLSAGGVVDVYEMVYRWYQLLASLSGAIDDPDGAYGPSGPYSVPRGGAMFDRHLATFIGKHALAPGAVDALRASGSATGWTAEDLVVLTDAVRGVRDDFDADGEVTGENYVLMLAGADTVAGNVAHRHDQHSAAGAWWSFGPTEDDPSHGKRHHSLLEALGCLVGVLEQQAAAEGAQGRAEAVTDAASVTVPVPTSGAGDGPWFVLGLHAWMDAAEERGVGIDAYRLDVEGLAAEDQADAGTACGMVVIDCARFLVEKDGDTIRARPVGPDDENDD